jgi:ParB family chromosome partitioning protein
LARANPEHAERLLGALRATALSTRELRCWFKHYQGANRTLRERLITHPRLFLEAVHSRDEQGALERLRAGPEGECLTDLRGIEAIIARLRKRLPTLYADALPEALASAFARLRITLQALQNELTRYGEHDPTRDTQRGTHPASARPDLARDQSATQAVT